SLCASAGYLINDLLDLEADRQHLVKRDRSFASGRLPLQIGIVAIPCLSAATILLGMILPSPTGLYLFVYFISTMAYSLFLKLLRVVDTLTLAGLYTLRIMAGGVAAQVQISEWLAAFLMFFFLCRAILKRFIEIKRALGEERLSQNGR